MSCEKILLVPMAGYGKRFSKAGYALPKQFLRMNNETCLEYSLKSLDLDYFDKVVIGCREEFDRQYNVKAFLESKFEGVPFEVIDFNADTKGSLDTVYLMMQRMDVQESAEISIFTLDVKFKASKALLPMQADAEVLVVKTNNPGFSYVKFDADSPENAVIQTAEKRIISEYGAVGLYRFKSASVMKEMFLSELEGEPNYGGEYFLCPVYNRYVDAGYTVKGVMAEQMLMFGTPVEYEFCRALRTKGAKRIAVAADHSGFEAKEKFISEASKRGYVVDDFGCYSSAPCDYEDFVYPSVKSVLENRNDFSVSFCRSGQGVNISASSVKGIRSVLVYDSNEGLITSLHHNAPNHFSMPGSFVDEKYLNNFFEAIESNEFEGGRHQDRLTKVLKHEAN